MSQCIRCLDTLQQLLELTEQMIVAARDGLWESVPILDRQRVNLLQAQSSPTDEDEDRQRRLNDSIRSADERLLAHVTLRREQMAKEGAQQRSRSTAVRGYRDAQSLRYKALD